MDSRKTVMITGATSGIGMAFARAYGQQGYKLILCGRREERLEQLKNELNTDCQLFTCELADEGQCRQLAAEISDINIDILINNAGFGLAGSFTETDLDREINMIKVNDIAQHILFKAVLKQMVKRNSGTIVNVASSAGLMPGGPYMATYYASKAYMTALTRAVSQELKEAGSNVYVCALCPGPVDTEFNQKADVIFSLKGISAERCVEECLKAMKKGRTIIVPTLTMKAVSFFAHLLPPSLMVTMTGHQQKKKLYR